MDNDFQVSQEEDTFPKNINLEHYAYRYAYVRSTDSRNFADPGQDYLTFTPQENTFTFALCDGVSQSFFGNIGAKLLGDGLLSWLSSNNVEHEHGRLQASLSNFLVNYAKETVQIVEKYSLPEKVPSMLRDVLEKKREHGSESTFVCGRIDFPSRTLSRGRVLFAWMGDSRLRFWRNDQECSQELDGEFITSQRFSTKKGPVGGDPNVFIADLGSTENDNRITKVLAYSDGITSIDGYKDYISQKMLFDLLISAMESPTSDDISLIEIFTDTSARKTQQTHDKDATINIDRGLTSASKDVPTKPRPF